MNESEIEKERKRECVRETDESMSEREWARDEEGSSASRERETKNSAVVSKSRVFRFRCRLSPCLVFTRFFLTVASPFFFFPVKGPADADSFMNKVKSKINQVAERLPDFLEGALATFLSPHIVFETHSPFPNNCH